MKGHIRNIVFGKPYAFIKASTGLDNIFLHRDNYHGDWSMLVTNIEQGKGKLTIKVVFDLEEGKLGPRAVKCSRISNDEWKELE